MLWSSATAAPTDLQPTNLSNYVSSAALGVGGGQQVGWGGYNNQLFSQLHALAWTGTANSAVDLQPTSLTVVGPVGGPIVRSEAIGTDGVHQVGDGGYDPEDNPFSGQTDWKTHALLWSGTADSAIDLQPTNLVFSNTRAVAVSGNEQVGQGQYYSGGTATIHALLWHGTADSAVDLQPPFFDPAYATFAMGTDVRPEVGYGYGASGAIAILWSGTAASAVNLQQFLPSEFSDGNGSKADTIDAQVNIFGEAYDNDYVLHAVEWIAIPEPETMLLLLITAPSSCLRPRRNA